MDPYRSLNGTSVFYSLPYLGWAAEEMVQAMACMCAKSLSWIQLFAILWTIARQSPMSMGFPRQEYWSGLPCPPPGDLPDPGKISCISWNRQVESSPLTTQETNRGPKTETLLGGSWSGERRAVLTSQGAQGEQGRSWNMATVQHMVTAPSCSTSVLSPGLSEWR